MKKEIIRSKTPIPGFKLTREEIETILNTLIDLDDLQKEEFILSLSVNKDRVRILGRSIPVLSGTDMDTDNDTTPVED